MINIVKNGIITNSGPDKEWLECHIEMGSFGSPGEYTVEYIDNSAQIAQDEINTESLRYLASTDWYITRFVESGVAVPKEIKAARAEARAKIVK